MAKFVFITGGVVSSIGKGIVAASLGRLLKSRATTFRFSSWILPECGSRDDEPVPAW